MTREETIKLIETLAREAGINIAIEEEQNKKHEFKDGDAYYYIVPYGDVNQSEWTNHNIDKLRFDFGNVYRTEEEAEKASLNLRIMNKLRMFADKVNEGWEPDWKDNDDEGKWFITFEHHKQEWDAICTIYCEDFCAIYFKTKELAERAIEEVIIPTLEKNQREEKKKE